MKNGVFVQLAGSVLLLLSLPSLGDGKLPWEEYGRRVQTSGGMAALKTDGMFGEQVDLYDGRLSFSVTDIEVPGNSRLPVRLTRAFRIYDREQYLNDAALADWELDLPRLSGVFAGTWHSQRCSGPRRPPSVTLYTKRFSANDYWFGNHAHMPGGGEMLEPNPAVPLPASGGPYTWVTAGRTYFSCLASLRNGPGEGFLAITADGTRYWFDWMAQYAEPPLDNPVDPTGNFDLVRRRNVLYATRVEDRFGNWVVYNFSNSATAPARLNSIQANDGRQITLTHTAQGHVASASVGARTWTYEYVGGSLGRVVLSDGSRWVIGFGGLREIEIDLSDNYGRSCDHPGVTESTGIGTVTHPSGAVGEFEVSVRLHGRSNVPYQCNWQSTQNDLTDDVSTYVRNYWAPSLMRKRITGPGLTAMQWQYSVGATGDDPGSAPGSWAQGPYSYDYDGDFSRGAKPVCVSDSCAGRTTTVVTGPGGEWARYTFGNSYRYDEHKLLEVERGTAPSSILRTEQFTYDLAQSGRPFAQPIGKNPQGIGGDGGHIAGYPRPQLAKVITQDGVSFSSAVNSFDVFARPLSVSKTSPWYTRTIVTSYYDNQSKWVLGQLATQSTNGIQTSRTDYWPDTALPQQTWAFGKAQHYFTYNADGTMASVTDGRNHTTALSGWKRGSPQSIAYPDGTSESAVVNDHGWITAVTDENGHSTGYGYDAMGRLASIVHPGGDSTAWNAVTMAFTQISSAERGLPANHWRHDRNEGNRRTHTYYDALWRPVMTLDYDIGDPTYNTQSQVIKRYDVSGRLTFQSYPTRHVADFNAVLPGIRTLYDALDRVTAVQQDSELGLLTTTTEYLSGFRTRVTNPRGQQTLTGYFVHDTPHYDLPAWIQHSAGRYTDIDRDVFGKPTAVTRRNADHSQSVIRRYVYDGYQQLCKTIEPETGATVMDYDAAGNLAWSASGHNLPDAGACNTAEGYGGGRRVDRSYDARNRLLTLNFPDGRGDQSWSYTPDGLPAQIVTYNDSAVQVVNNYNYNKRRLLTGESVAQPGWYSWGIGYGYDANGNLSVQTYPTGLAVNYSPNALGQPTRAGTWAQNARYYANGAIAQFTYGNGIVHTMTQNARQLPARSTDAGAINYAYTYDANANATHIADDQQGGHYSRSMTYDGLDRLTDAGSCSFGGDCWHRFTYDALDNLKSWRLPGIKDYANYVYDAGNRLNAIRNSSGSTLVTLGYDAQGNLNNKNGQPYSFDFGNRLRASSQEWYRYDGHGRRVLNWRKNEPGVLSQYSQAGQLLYDANYRASGRKASEYIYLAGGLVATRERNIDTNAVATKYQHTDALGSPAAVSNEAGAVISRTQWEPFGAAVQNPGYDGIGYAGHVMDSASGLTYMQQRYYDPQIGRFLSVDPVAARPLGDNFNRYWYADDNPYRFTDPDGRETNPVSRGAGISNDQLRTNTDNPDVGRFGNTRSANNWNEGYHNGVDIRARIGTALFAPISGTVISFHSERGGNVVRIRTERNGQIVEIGMAHLSRVDVRNGDQVVEGQTQIGLSGDTGNAGGLPADEEHVHLRVTVGGAEVDPQTHFEENPPAEQPVDAPAVQPVDPPPDG